MSLLDELAHHQLDKIHPCQLLFELEVALLIDCVHDLPLLLKTEIE